MQLAGALVALAAVARTPTQSDGDCYAPGHDRHDEPGMRDLRADDPAASARGDGRTTGDA